MTMRPFLRGALAAAGLLLAACAPLRTHEDTATLRVQAEREARLGMQTVWGLEGRLAVSNGTDGGNADLRWRQDGDGFDVTLNAPVSGKTWILQGAPGQSVLDGVGEAPLRGRDPAELLERELGWHVPVDQLGFWVRALRAPHGRAVLVFDAEQRPATLEQNGWKVEYREYFPDTEPPLPRKVFASRGKYRVRLFIERWQTP